MTQAEHQPVLLDAALSALAIVPAGCYVDATYGRGGHSGAILDALGGSGRLAAFDRDPAAEADARRRFAHEPRLRFWHDSFTKLAQRIGESGLTGKVDGLLFDLGASSPQFDDPARGFSFQRPGPLDMRMDPEAGIGLGEWLADASVGEVRGVLRRYGEERFAARIARAVIAARDAGELTDTAALAAAIKRAVPAPVVRGRHIHPATRCFQAFRIHINDELGALRQALDAAMAVLAPGGRLVVISFHSLEDRIVKRFVRSQACPEPPPLPMTPAPEPALRRIGKAVRAGHDEVTVNPRARSAIMRVAERTAAKKVAS